MTELKLRAAKSFRPRRIHLRRPSFQLVEGHVCGAARVFGVPHFQLRHAVFDPDLEGNVPIENGRDRLELDRRAKLLQFGVYTGLPLGDLRLQAMVRDNP